MSIYYFDFIYNNSLTTDHDGTDHPDEFTARQELHRTMLQLGRDGASAECGWQITGVIRDERGEVWRGRITFEPLSFTPKA